VGLLKDIADMGLALGYQRYVLDLEPVLVDMSKRGIPVAPVEHARVMEQLKGEVARLLEDMQAMVPIEIRKVKHYKTKPDKLLPWKPSGGAKGQLVAYMKHRGHAVPRAFKSDDETTAELELRRLAKQTRDPLYDKVIEYRELLGLRNNHCKNWTPGADGRVHPTFYYETGTGQLGARRPNSMNAPKHKANQGDIFRSMIVAREGHTLVEVDYKAFHVQTLAFEAQDRDLLRLAKLDVHSFLTAHFLRIPGADALISCSTEELQERLARIKAEHHATRDAKVKHAMLGYNNGMGYRKCFHQYMEFFDGQNECKRIFELLDSLFPKAKSYRQEVCDLAHRQGYLISRFGCIRWFWEVYKWGDQGKWTFGEDHEAALSFFTQNDGHCHLKDAMLRLRALGVDEEARLINPIHDALMFEVPDANLPSVIPIIIKEMERPSEVLVDPVVAPGGLSVEVEAKVGKSWNRMSEWRRHGTAIEPHNVPDLWESGSETLADA
jgi:DNA polymerase I-like protein with 3'-5' exonuclease and polymerase domains